MSTDDESKTQYSEAADNHAKNLEEIKRLKTIYLSEINSKPEIQEYLQQFRDDSIESFKNELAELQAKYDLYSAEAFKDKENVELYFINEAKELIWCIQQKKLFDTQCRWRAGNIEIPEIVIIEDFEYWSDNIKNCNFIDPISEEDVHLLQQYLSSANYEEELIGVFEWQEYDDWKEEHMGDPDGLSSPEWYHFYNMYRGTESLLIQPDIKKEYEEKCIDAGMFSLDREVRRKLIVAAITEDPVDETMEVTEDDPLPVRKDYSHLVSDSRPYLFFGREEIDEFVALFEDNEMKELHEAKRTINKTTELTGWEMMPFNAAVYNLRYAGDDYPMKPFYKWREGVIKLGQEFKNLKICEVLPLVFEEYKMRIDMGIAPYLTNAEIDGLKQKKKRVELYREFYRNGKKILEAENE